MYMCEYLQYVNLWFVFRRETERRMEEERVRMERARAVMLQFEPQRAQEMAAYSQASGALQNAQAQAATCVRIMESFITLPKSSEFPAGAKCYTSAFASNH